ncbi:Store-operated calcium entry-associated regulatory factor [Fulvia fulva]|uniref:Store-operated calcium entry-associated regulatory factor n=1 Tax=Passalora fulva TaxID=5499 RepID=A0A9Q8PAC1_PASFU|nr:Store-operated calcium entry-associated regulatory factor [Fulvia fulva]KAK4621242.1 Store-operated calcium entry-associated regulatory factor [Fulvia fulva]KAK4622522.1 Store-operated calcium entry-associated regulatory factor [Fulvia fulva]UJO18780.1 Store-operated calcium entry-associated regulatory factor [Fulvia fulva]WPV16532.1 Store-operated calcium entry-associated regulatory factor [Fulvia fulva]WPV30733.1 Store-operated calcium entry-associated regulatory factor [Fulvia fulva]
MHLSGLVALLALATSSLAYYSKQKDAVKLSSIKTLTLRDGALTSARRVEPIPQLTCIGGNAKGLYDVDVMRCTNAGSDYGAEDIQWTCKASLPPEFKLGSTDVICEGYENPDDPYILKGSCGVEYRLILTPQGEAKYHDRVNNKAWRSKNRSGDESSLGDGLATTLFWIIFVAIVCVILYSVFTGGNRNGGRRPGNGRRAGGNFWGGGDDNDDPPPPYTPRGEQAEESAGTWTPIRCLKVLEIVTRAAVNSTSPRSPSRRGNRSSLSDNSSSGQPKPKPSSRGSSSQQNEPWRPGFWSGTAAGTAAGYAAGAWNASRQARAQEARNAYARPGPSNYNAPSGYGSWGAGESNRHDSDMDQDLGHELSSSNASTSYRDPARESTPPSPPRSHPRDFTTRRTREPSRPYSATENRAPARSSSSPAPSSSRQESTGFGGTRRR